MPTGLRQLLLPASFAATLLFATHAPAATPTAEQALELKPIQADVDFERPAKADVPQCSVEIDKEKKGNSSGWIVRGPAGQTLRRFLDTNDDNKVDQWCYYKDGIEIYRDLDLNFNGKVDQFRWLGTAGIRWGSDKDEDGRIDAWKQISPEEVTAEIVAAVREKDAVRFATVLLSPNDVEALGLGESHTAEMKKRAAEAAATFVEAARKQKVVAAKSQWINFGATKPGTIPAGTDGSRSDVLVYDNVAAVIETEGKHSQLQIGTLVRVGEAWKVFELPKNLNEELAAGGTTGFFFAGVAEARLPQPMTPMNVNNPGEIPPAAQKLVTEISKIDQEIASSKTAAARARLQESRADLAEKIIAIFAPQGENYELWVKQYAETLSVAIQQGEIKDGLARLQKLKASVEKNGNHDLAVYVTFREIMTDYNTEIAKPNANFAKLTDKKIDDLKEIATKFDGSPELAEVFFELAMTHEFVGKDEEAIQWYTRVTKEFKEDPLALKSTGAKRRLQSIGQPMVLTGNTLDSKTFNMSAAKGRVVLIQYWATWCGPCKEDMEVIKRLQAKYAKQGFQPIGVNLDTTAPEAVAFLKTKPMPWPHLHEKGGLDGRHATEMGIFTLPAMILVDATGKVVNRSITVDQLDAEIGKLLK